MGLGGISKVRGRVGRNFEGAAGWVGNFDFRFSIFEGEWWDWVEFRRGGGGVKGLSVISKVWGLVGLEISIFDLRFSKVSGGIGWNFEGLGW